MNVGPPGAGLFGPTENKMKRRAYTSDWPPLATALAPIRLRSSILRVRTLPSFVAAVFIFWQGSVLRPAMASPSKHDPAEVRMYDPAKASIYATFRRKMGPAGARLRFDCIEMGKAPESIVLRTAALLRKFGCLTYKLCRAVFADSVCGRPCMRSRGVEWSLDVSFVFRRARRRAVADPWRCMAQDNSGMQPHEPASRNAAPALPTY